MELAAKAPALLILTSFIIVVAGMKAASSNRSLLQHTHLIHRFQGTGVVNQHHSDAIQDKCTDHNHGVVGTEGKPNKLKTD